MKSLIQVIADLGTEFRSVMRALAHKPGYAIAAWVMLGLAIAANIAVFAITYGLLLKPLPYPSPGELAIVRERVPGIGLNTPLVSVKTYLELKRDLNGVANAGLATNPNGDIASIDGRPHLITFQSVTPSLFATLGVVPALGRVLAPSTGQTGGPAEAVISWNFWQSAFGGNPNVLDQALELDGRNYRIVGVMPHGFFFGRSPRDAWLPYVITPERAQDGNINYWMYVRRKPGVSLTQLNLELHGMTQRILNAESPKVRALDIKDGYTIDARTPRAVVLDNSGVGRLPWIMQAAAGLLLLLALANTINLALVRQRDRQQQFAVRRALGASGTTLTRLILLEHLPVAAAVGVTSMLLAWAGISALRAFGLPPPSSPFQFDMAPIVISLGWALSIVAVLIVSLSQASLTATPRILETIGSSRTVAGGRAARRLQRGLGVIQIALACALVIAGGLLGLSLWHVLTQPLGFSPANRYMITVATPGSLSNTDAWAALKPKLLGLAQVHSAAVTGMVPFSGDSSQGGISKIGASNNLIVNMPVIGADYFSTMGIGLAAGRAFTHAEIASKAPVVIINAALANHFFGSPESAVGQYLQLGSSSPKFRIAGVARDVAWAPTPDQYRYGTAYLPLWAIPEEFNVIVAVDKPSSALAGLLKQTVQQALPGSVVFRISSLNGLVQSASVFRAAGASVVGTFAMLAVVLAALGAFAITAFIAHAHLAEYGIRAALGAEPLRLLLLGFREAAWLLGIGLPIGVIGAWLLGRALASTLFQTPVLEPGLYITGAILIAVVVFAAVFGPAHKAARTPVRELIDSGGTR